MHCKSNKSQDMLQATNPAILQLEPRAGGLVQLEGKGGSCKCKSKKSISSVGNVNSRASRIGAAKEMMIKQGLAEMDWTATATGNDYASIGIYNPVDDSITMLTTVISTILLMATDSKIPCVHLDWTQKYLNCIKDENGNHPPNVQGILNHMRYILGEREEKEKSSENVSKKGSKCSHSSKGSKGSKGSKSSKNSQESDATNTTNSSKR